MIGCTTTFEPGVFHSHGVRCAGRTTGIDTEGIVLYAAILKNHPPPIRIDTVPVPGRRYLSVGGKNNAVRGRSNGSQYTFNPKLRPVLILPA